MSPAKADARWRDAALLTIALWAFVILIFMPGIVARHHGDAYSILLDSSTVVVSVSLGLTIFAIFRETLDWPSQWRMLVLGVALFGAAITHASFDLLYTAWITDNVRASWVGISTDFMTRGYETAFRYLLVFTVNLALFQLSYVRINSLRSERQLTDARSAAQQAQLEALRYQLNPHFLFNTLNSISSLIVTGRNDDAEQMTNKLSSFLRASLTCDPGGLVPLDEELALIEEYLDIEAVRFGKRLNVEIHCNTDAGAALIPSFLVQPLVENAIKHGVAPSRDPVTVSIDATLEEAVLCIIVRNSPMPAEDGLKVGGTGVGLLNVRQRLQAVYGERASLTTESRDGTFAATICIPGVKARP